MRQVDPGAPHRIPVPEMSQVAKGPDKCVLNDVLSEGSGACLESMGRSRIPLQTHPR